MFSKLVLTSLAVGALSVNALVIPPSVKSSVASGLGSVGELPRSFSALPYRDLTLVSAALALLPTAASFLIKHYESQNDPSNSTPKREPEPEFDPIGHLMDMFVEGDHILFKRDPLSGGEVLNYISSLVEPQLSKLGIHPNGLPANVVSPSSSKREPETWEDWGTHVGNYYANKYGSPDDVPGLAHP